MTVSRVLRGTGRTSQATTEKVKAAAKQLGYRPNPMVQCLMTHVRKQRVEQTSNIAWVMTHRPNESIAEPLLDIERGAQTQANELGYAMIRFHLDPELQDAQALARILKARGVQGGIIAPVKNPSVQPVFPWEDFALATIGRSLSRPALHYTMSHHYHIMQQVLDKVCDHGYHKIGLLIGSPSWEVRVDYATVMVFQQYCLQAGIAPDIAYQTCGRWSSSDHLDWFKHFQPDAIIADYGYRYRTLVDAGLPMAKVGFASLSWKKETTNCSGIKQPFHALGASAVDLVSAQIIRNERGLPHAPKAILMEGEWVEGNTLSRISGE